MSARATRRGAGAALAAVLAAAPLGAQQAPTADSTGRLRALYERVEVAAHIATFSPSGGSELYALLDDALAPGHRPLRPRVRGGELHLRLAPRWGVLLGAETGERTMASASRAIPDGGTSQLRQQTTLDLTAVQWLGAEWEAYRWRGDRAADPAGAAQPRLVLGAGGGLARYRLRQWGEFVDVPRGLGFADDLVSTGTGAFGYASAGVDVPLNHWSAFRFQLRRHVGSAPMSADYATFDRLDLDGTRVSMAVRVRPAALGRR